MKRAAMGHSKLKKLARRLGVASWGAVGILECLWHLTARETPRGDIGRLSDEDIALALDWDEDPGRLVCALTESGWLDPDPDCRLIVHDWHEHADDAIQIALFRKTEYFAGGQKPRPTRLSREDRARFEALYAQADNACAHKSAQDTPKSALPEPEPKPCTPPTPPWGGNGSGLETNSDGECREFGSCVPDTERENPDQVTVPERMQDGTKRLSREQFDCLAEIAFRVTGSRDVGSVDSKFYRQWFEAGGTPALLREVVSEALGSKRKVGSMAYFKKALGRALKSEDEPETDYAALANDLSQPLHHRKYFAELAAAAGATH